jgi:4-hydroxybenzoate polyprenyltransferase/phosphoserine phosphatase
MIRMSGLGAVRARDAKLPLAVDLDGTLMRGDIFIEAMLRYISAKPLRVFTLVGWLMRGRAYAKAQLAQAAPCDPAILPYEPALLEWLAAQRAEGRTVVLATASNQRDAERVAAHLGLFDRVFASDENTNLKSRRKAQALSEAYPEGFVYAGNETADLKVWRAASAAVVVNASSSLTRRAQREFEVEHTVPPQGGTLRGLIKAIRPQQWAKNVLVFVPMLVGQGWFDAQAWTNAFIAFFAMSFAASCIYLINDASDIDADRRHHRKRTRPFASGALSPMIGLPVAVLLAVGGLSLGALVGAIWLVAAYMIANGFYTFWLKTKQIADVFTLAGLYIVRVVLGGVATGFLASSWLLAFCGFFFFSLALCKRVTEVETAAAGGGVGLSRRGYRATDGSILKMMGVTSGFMSCLVLALYIQSDIATAEHYRWPLLLWLLPASVMYWFGRVWLLTERGKVHDDPLIWAFRDRVSWILGAIAAAGLAGAVLLEPIAIVQ